MKILLATQNSGKQKELQALLSSFGVEVLLPISNDDVEETGSTFEENALIKAKFFQGKNPEWYVLADDSGLEVDALGGRPGVFSKRYGSDDAHRNQKILSELEALKDPDRTARFVSVLVLLGKDGEHIFRGEVEGVIAREVKGAQGFGYDPIFVPRGYDQTFAELGASVKNAISHRAVALEKLKKYIQESYKQV